MLQLKYNGSFLDLGANQKLEFERENPMFMLEDFYKEYSTPIVIKYSENNVSLLGAVFFDSYAHQQLRLDVELWDDGTFDNNVLLVIDKANPDRKNSGKGDVNGYLLAGISRFFYKIKFRYLNTLRLGGERVFNFTTADPTDGSDGYFQHFFATANNTFDYMIAPVRNDIFNGTTETSSGWMNDWYWQNLSNTPAVPTTDKDNRDYFSQHEHKCAVLFPRLKYVLTQIFEENGYSLDTTALDGTSWEDIFLESLFPVYFYNSIYRQIYDGAGEGALTHPFAPEIKIDLSDSISPEVTCANFVIQICKKYGWAIIEGDSNSFRLIALKKVKSFKSLDITKKVSNSVQTDFSAGERIQGFSNTFPDGEQFAVGKTPQLSDEKYFENPVETVDQLPDLTDINTYNLSTYDNSLVYVYGENKYYNIQLVTSTVTVWNNTRGWTPFVDNIYNLEIPNKTENIESSVTTLPVYWTQFSISGSTMPLIIDSVEVDNVLLYGYFPVCKQSRFGNWGIRTVLFVGIVNAYYMQTATGPLTLAMSIGSSPYSSTKTIISSLTYPLLSNCRNNGVTDILPWSNCYTHVNPTDGKDYGIVEYWFKDWLDTIGLTNVYEQNIYLPKDVLKKLTYDTILTIYNVPYLIRSYTEPRPYKDFILAKLVRLSMDKNDGSVSISSNIYLKLYWEDVEAAADFEQAFPYRQPTDHDLIYPVELPIPYLYKITDGIKGNLVVKAYSDPLCRNLISGLYLKLSLRIYITDTSGNILDITQFSDFGPIENIPLKPGNYHTTIFLKDGTGVIGLSTLINDLGLIPWTIDKIPFAFFYNTYWRNVDLGNIDPFAGDFPDIPFSFAIPNEIPPTTDGKYIMNGTLDVPSQIEPSYSTTEFPYFPSDGYTKDIIQHVELRYSPNYIIIP